MWSQFPRSYELPGDVQVFHKSLLELHFKLDELWPEKMEWMVEDAYSNMYIVKCESDELAIFSLIVPGAAGFFIMLVMSIVLVRRVPPGTDMRQKDQDDWGNSRM